MGNRIHLLPQVLPIWEHEWSELPDKIRASTEQGKVVDYVLAKPQQKPVLVELVDKFTQTCFGGQKYKQKNRRKRNGMIKEETP